MVINVRNALRSPGEAFKAEGRMEYQPLEFMGKLAFEGPVLFSGEICSNGEGVVLSGRAQAELRMNCNRCDREFIMPVNAAVSEMYYLEPAPGHERVLKDSQWLSLDAVSYTHLDVYKRQELGRWKLKNLPFAAHCILIV